MRKRFLFIAVFALLVWLAAAPALASPGLTVGHSGGKGISPEVLPGESYTQTLLVSIGKDDAATDVLIEVLGYGEGVEPLLPEEDISSYSARTFIKPGKITLHVEPGEIKQTDVTITIPPDVGDGGRYAILRFSTVPPEEGTVKIISAIVLPVKFTIKDSQLIHQGKITGVTTGKADSGQPVDIFTTFQNTGNHHFKIEGKIEIRDASDKLIDTLHITTSSPIPDGTKRIKTTYIPQGELALGVYSVKSRLMLEDGTILDEAEGSFEVDKPYVPPSQPVETPPAPPFPAPITTPTRAVNWAVLGGIVAGVIVIALLGYFLAIRRRGY